MQLELGRLGESLAAARHGTRMRTVDAVRADVCGQRTRGGEDARAALHVTREGPLLQLVLALVHLQLVQRGEGLGTAVARAQDRVGLVVSAHVRL